MMVGRVMVGRVMVGRVWLLRDGRGVIVGIKRCDGGWLTLPKHYH